MNKSIIYIIRVVKYLLFICVLYIAIEWVNLMMSSSPNAADYDVWDILQLRIATDDGRMLIGAFVLLAVFYPLFGFMRKRVDGCSFEHDMIRINNAMNLYGFKLKEDRGNVKIYQAENILRRITLMFEDKIEVSAVNGGIELKGLRRTVARVVYQLQTYMYNSRHEEDRE